MLPRSGVDNKNNRLFQWKSKIKTTFREDLNDIGQTLYDQDINFVPRGICVDWLYVSSDQKVFNYHIIQLEQNKLAYPAGCLNCLKIFCWRVKVASSQGFDLVGSTSGSKYSD